MRSLRIALAQINPTVGDLEGNAEKILQYVNEARAAQADLVAFPELALTGYPPEDLLLKTQFIQDNLKALERICAGVKDITAVVGYVDWKDDLYNAAAVIHNGTVVDVYRKVYLPNYGVFDEYRYFQAGKRLPVYSLAGTCVGINICEDIWYPEGPSRFQSLAGAEVIINMNASPFHIGKGRFREKMLATRAVDNIAVIAYLNTVGGQDELVFDGQSLVVDQDGNILAMGKQFEEDLIVTDLNLDAVMMRRLHSPRRRRETGKFDPGLVEKVTIPVERNMRAESKPAIPAGTIPSSTEMEEVYSALILGTRDYVRKNGFRSVIIGLSGGIDSSIVAAIAVDAVGKENVRGLFMPSPFTSAESREDAFGLAENLGIEISEIPITEIHQAYLNSLEPEFRGLRPDTTEENIQARIRGNILMAFSNKLGSLVLTTGNKSEMSVGYATLYGDMAGGFAVIKDIPKTMVYDLCRWKNLKAGAMVIPERMFTKEPSAELKPDQKDSDALPPYAVLDPILKAYIEEERTIEEILALRYGNEGTREVVEMIDRSEYKRRQAPPGIKISQRAFGKDRRFPITNRYRGF